MDNDLSELVAMWSQLTTLQQAVQSEIDQRTVDLQEQLQTIATDRDQLEELIQSMLPTSTTGHDVELELNGVGLGWELKQSPSLSSDPDTFDAFLRWLAADPTGLRIKEWMPKEVKKSTFKSALKSGDPLPVGVGSYSRFEFWIKPLKTKNPIDKVEV